MPETLPKMSAHVFNVSESKTYRYKWEVSKVKDYVQIRSTTQYKYPAHAIEKQVNWCINKLYEPKNKEERDMYSKFIMLIFGVSLQDKVVLECHEQKLTKWSVVYGLQSTFAIFYDEYKTEYTIVYAGKQRPVNGVFEYEQL